MAVCENYVHIQKWHEEEVVTVARNPTNMLTCTHSFASIFTIQNHCHPLTIWCFVLWKAYR